jgi:hypothetical protein
MAMYSVHHNLLHLTILLILDDKLQRFNSYVTVSIPNIIHLY